MLFTFLYSAEFKSERQRTLEYQLNAPCCWGGVIAEHDSPIAQQIKQLIVLLISNSFAEKELISKINEIYSSNDLFETIKSLIHNKMSDNEIIDLFSLIHGEKIRALPKDEGIGWIAWKLPTFILFVSLITAVIIVKKISFRKNYSKKFELSHKQIQLVDDEMKKRGL